MSVMSFLENTIFQRDKSEYRAGSSNQKQELLSDGHGLQ